MNITAITRLLKDKAAWGQNISAGLVIGIQLILYALASAVLLGLTDLSQGIGIALFTSLLITVFTILFSRSETIINSAPDIPVMLIGVMLAGIISQFHQYYPTENPLPTLAMTILISTLCISISMYIFGYFRLGKFVKIFPFPVIGGFFAGFGWFIFITGFKLTLDAKPDLTMLYNLFTPASLHRWVPAMLAAIVLYFTIDKIKKKWYLLAYILTIISLFYCSLFLLGINIEVAQKDGYLFMVQSGNNLLPKLSYFNLNEVHWHLIRANAINILFLCIIVLSDIFLRISGFEIISKTDIDTDYELKFLGLSNLLTGLLGGIPAYISMSNSAINYKMGGNVRLMGFICMALILFILLSGTALLNLTPKIIIAMILLYMGMSFMKTWIIDIRKQLHFRDHLLLLIVFLTIVLKDVFTGIFLGIAISAVIFLIRYCNLSILQRRASGADLHSNVNYAPEEEALLAEKRREIYIVQLRHYLFFGNIMQLTESLKQVFSDKQIHFIIIDFRKVYGEDVSVHNNMVRIMQSAKNSGVELLFSDLNQEDIGLIKKFAAEITPPLDAQYFETTDYALEYCESKLLEKYGSSLKKNKTFIEQLQAFVPNSNYAEQFASIFQSRKITKDSHICKSGEKALHFYIVNQGEIDILVVDPDGSKLRVSKVMTGALTGEIGYFSRGLRSADMVAATDLIVYQLSYQDFDEYSKSNPELALCFLKKIAEKIASNLETTNKLLLSSNLSR